MSYLRKHTDHELLVGLRHGDIKAFLKPGEFEVRLQAEFNDPPVTLDTLIKIIVLDNIKPDFLPDIPLQDGKLIIHAGDEIKYTSTSAGAPSFYQWNFEGGIASISTNSIA